MTFNGKNNQPRKSSTNQRVLSARISHLENNNNTKVTFVPLRGNPPPVSNNFKTVKRTVTVPFSGSGTTYTVDSGDVSTALAGATGDFQVLRVDVYSTATTASASPSATFTLLQSNLLLNNTTLGALQNVVVTDYGTASSLPGVRFNIPKGRGVWITKDTAGTAGLVNSTQAGVCVFSVMQQLSSA